MEINDSKNIIIFVLLFIILMMYIFRPRLNPNNNQNNIEIVDDNEIPKIINFNTSWCYWSKNLQPIWDKLTNDFKNKNINIVDIKCDKKKNLNICEKFNIEGYPSIKLINRKEVIDYNGDRTLDDLKKFIYNNVKY